MAKYIDVDNLHNQGWVAARYKNWEPTSLSDNFRLEVEVKPFITFSAADVVSRGVLEQVMWERDLAISQLAEIGKGIGEKMDDVEKVRHGCWIMHIDDLFPEESTMECNQCHEEQPLDCDDKYCPNCGAKMERSKE